ncbi:serpentine type 7TM GPCR chemoreceptor srt domain-containing protein [Ditylenchus destructor]|uniref:Serpentine type 7TM GPCR chemoreceptor srt domain-containing protein n=1 Tax=Ditylenchus destructor TaxID=166010 RepID=A0AAD4QXM7_9BILA|nr:serpentine type 7TM GPCR chemoreceptor srt domain-containing protein [Ditylenchus destructor]
MIVSSIICLILNGFLIKVIYRDNELKRMNSYRFLLAIAISDVVQLITHFISGFFTVFQADLNHTFNKILGAVPGYKLYALFSLVLAFNRFIAISSPSLDFCLFSQRAMKLWYIIVFSIAGFFGLGHSSPWASILYSPQDWSWSYDFDLPFSRVMKLLGAVVEIGTIFIAGVLYVLIFLNILFKRNSGQIVKKRDPRDLMVLSQGCSITTYCTISNILWYNYQYFLPETRVTYMIINYMWIWNSAINPCAHIIVNKTLRQRMGIVLGPVRKVTTISGWKKVEPVKQMQSRKLPVKAPVNSDTTDKTKECKF